MSCNSIFILGSFSPVMSVASVATLQSSNFRCIDNGQAIELLGYYSVGDGGGGMFFLRESRDGELPNNGVTFTLSDGRIAERIYGGDVNVMWFGAKMDGCTDDTAALQAAIDYVYYNFDLSVQYPKIGDAGSHIFQNGTTGLQGYAACCDNLGKSNRVLVPSGMLRLTDSVTIRGFIGLCGTWSNNAFQGSQLVWGDESNLSTPMIIWDQDAGTNATIQIEDLCIRRAQNIASLPVGSSALIVVKKATDGYIRRCAFSAASPCVDVQGLASFNFYENFCDINAGIFKTSGDGNFQGQIHHNLFYGTKFATDAATNGWAIDIGSSNGDYGVEIHHNQFIAAGDVVPSTGIRIFSQNNDPSDWLGTRAIIHDNVFRGPTNDIDIDYWNSGTPILLDDHSGGHSIVDNVFYGIRRAAIAINAYSNGNSVIGNNFVNCSPLGNGDSDTNGAWNIQITSSNNLVRSNIAATNGTGTNIPRSLVIFVATTESGIGFPSGNTVESNSVRGYYLSGLSAHAFFYQSTGINPLGSNNVSGFIENQSEAPQSYFQGDALRVTEVVKACINSGGSLFNLKISNPTGSPADYNRACEDYFVPSVPDIGWVADQKIPFARVWTRMVSSPYQYENQFEIGIITNAPGNAQDGYLAMKGGALRIRFLNDGSFWFYNQAGTKTMSLDSSGNLKTLGTMTASTSP